MAEVPGSSLHLLMKNSRFLGNTLGQQLHFLILRLALLMQYFFLRQKQHTIFRLVEEEEEIKAGKILLSIFSYSRALVYLKKQIITKTHRNNGFFPTCRDCGSRAAPAKFYSEAQYHTFHLK